MTQLKDTFKSETLKILSERGFVNQCTDLEGLDEAFAKGPVTSYIGYDPTAPSLHIGHLVTIMMMYWLQQTGNKPLTLMGGATALIGDPSFKDAARPMMTLETIKNNIQSIQTVFSSILKYGDGRNDALMVNNDDWFKNVGYIELLREYGPHFSVNRMLSFDSVKNRLEREQHLSFLEFNYSILQSYDFLHLYKNYNCTLQLSGADQWANAISGVELGRKKEQAQLYVLTVALLTDANGKKMGKSEGNALWLNRDLQTDYDYYQYWRNVDDSMVEKMLKLFTTLPMEEVAKLSALKDAEINEAKKILAFEATKMLRGEEAAKLSADTAAETFAGSGRSDNLPKLQLDVGEDSAGLLITDLLVRSGLATSKSEARKLILGDGARLNDKLVTHQQARLEPSHFQDGGTAKLSAGKKRHVLIVK
jgi:tyrosyl-tRNA synthetase